MNEEEMFCKLFPEYAVNGKPLSPYFDLFERGYEEAENRAEELEKSCEETQKLLDKQIEATYKLDKENAELKKELKEWKDEWQEQVQKAIDEGYARTLQTMQLNRAKEIIKKLISDNRKVWVYSDVREEAEQFISEVEK